MMRGTEKRIAIYVRCSTARDQDPDVQLFQIRAFCQARGWIVVAEIVDHGFTGKTDKRPGLRQLMALVRSRKVDVVVISRLDRLFRCLKHLVGILQEFQDLGGVELVSLLEEIDMTTAAGRLMTQILGAFAEFEAGLIRERTLAGLERARAKGKRLGRPPKHNADAIVALRKQGLTYRQIQEKLNVPKGVVWEAIRSARETPEKPPSEDTVIAFEFSNE